MKVRTIVLMLLGVLGAYVALLLHPDPLFAHEVRYENVVLHSPQAFPPQALDVARRAHERLVRSPFFSAQDRYDVYLCDTQALFSLLALKPGAGGVAQIYFSGNTFLRPSRIDRDRLIGPLGREVPGERTLTYYVAHELTHTMLARSIGRVAYHGLTTWQQEGYADYVAKEAFDFEGNRAAFRAGARELDPLQSGLYLRYHLLVAEALDRQGLSPEVLLAGPSDAAPIEARLAAPPE